MKQRQPNNAVQAAVIDLLLNNPFTLEVQVKKNPHGLKVIYEVTKEQMEYLTSISQ